MAAPSKADRSGQWLLCLGGVALLFVGAREALESYSLGYLQFSYKRSIFTGPFAGLLIAAFLLFGAGFVGTSFRNLERS
jgi:hypothetical protein